MITIYGIPNCGSVKKAFAWFDEHKIPYLFHNFKKKAFPNPSSTPGLPRQ